MPRPRCSHGDWEPSFNPTHGSEVIDGNTRNSGQVRKALEDLHGDRSLWTRGRGRGRHARVSRQLELQLLE